MVINKEQREKIMARRWIIIIIVLLILITWLQLWEVVFYLFLGWLMLRAAVWVFDWMTGMDIDKHNRREINKRRKKEGLPPAQDPDNPSGFDDVSEPCGTFTPRTRLFTTMIMTSLKITSLTIN